jgi:hypothetical protein
VAGLVGLLIGVICAPAIQPWQRRRELCLPQVLWPPRVGLAVDRRRAPPDVATIGVGTGRDRSPRPHGALGMGAVGGVDSRNRLPRRFVWAPLDYVRIADEIKVACLETFFSD